MTASVPPMNQAREVHFLDIPFDVLETQKMTVHLSGADIARRIEGKIDKDMPMVTISRKEHIEPLLNRKEAGK